MFVVAVGYTHVAPGISVVKNGWDAWERWCRYSPRHMVSVNKYDSDGCLVGYAEAEDKFGTKVWHKPLTI